MPRSIAVAALALCAAAPAVHADVRAWTVCTAGALRSCHSISLEAIPVVSGGQRVGTAVVISLANLQGSGLPNTGATPTGLYQVIFTGPLASAVPTTVAQQSATMAGPGATGALTWQRFTTTPAIGGGFEWIELRGLPGSAAGVLGGCTPVATSQGPTTAQTCGPLARAVFTFSLSAAVDAGQFDNVFVAAYGAGGSAACNSNPASAPFFQQPCDVLEDPLAPGVVPEPVTLVLLGTGLFGVGALRRRRGG